MINSSYLMAGMVVAYAVIAGTSAYEGNWPRCWYWLSAAQITSSVLWMGMK